MPDSRPVEKTEVILQSADSSHSLTVRKKGIGIELEMLIVKKTIQPIRLTESPMTVEMIEEAWTQQGSNWFELYRDVHGTIFKAARVIWFPNGCLKWNLLHIEDQPFDTLGFTSLTREFWETIKKA